MKDFELALVRSSQLERCGWLICFLSMLTQTSAIISFPSYNILLGFWAAYWYEYNTHILRVLLIIVLKIILIIRFLAHLLEVAKRLSGSYVFQFYPLFLMLFSVSYILLMKLHIQWFFLLVYFLISF